MNHQVAPVICPPRRILMGPGPSDISPRVYSALSSPTVGHLDPYYLKIMDEMQAMLREVFQTKNELTLAVSGTGSSGMEACVVNLIEPGDKMLVCKNGIFGMRMADVAGRAGAEVITIEKDFGEIFSPEEIKEAVEKHQPKVVGIVHAETSTGALQPLEEISRIVHEAGALILVDCVTSLGGIPVKVDEWELDAVYSGTQKCLSCPPGLAPVTYSPKAVEAMDQRKTKVASWYLDMSMVREYWGGSRAYHHTAPINMNYALHEALRIILEEGLEARFDRHMSNHLALKAGLKELGIEYSVPEGQQLPMLNSVFIPEGVDDGQIRSQLLNDYGIEIGGGLGPVKGKTWRIGLMGVSSERFNVIQLLTALGECLSQAGKSVDTKAAVAAAHAVK